MRLSNKRTFTFIVVAACLVMFASVDIVMADIGPKKARALQQQEIILPLSHIIDKAMAIKSGKVLETELDQENDRYVYELEILDSNGQVWELEFDAQTGDLMEIEED